MANSSVGLPQLTQVDWISAQIALIDIRTQVFIHEQKISADDEWDHLDATSWHFLADLPGHTNVGCLRLTPEGQLSRLAVLKVFRRRGVAEALMRGAMQFGAQRFDRLFLHAQLPVVPFYQRLGFRVTGAEFLDAGLAHRPMTWLQASPKT